MEEIWKDIIGYEGLYQVSNFGKVKSLSRNVNNGTLKGRIIKEKILIPQDNGKGYLYVRLHKQNREVHYYIHRLVAQSFVENPHNYSQVNHINEKKYDNVMSNLEWCDCSYNIKYGTGNTRRLRSRNDNNNNNSEKEIHQYLLNGDYVRSYRSIAKAAKINNILENGIRACCKGYSKSAYGFIWSYIKMDNISPYQNTIKRKIEQLTLEGKHVAYFSSIREAGIMTSSNISKICDCCKGRRKYTNGYKWKYYE